MTASDNANGFDRGGPSEESAVAQERKDIELSGAEVMAATECDAVEDFDVPPSPDMIENLAARMDVLNHEASVISNDASGELVETSPVVSTLSRARSRSFTAYFRAKICSEIFFYPLKGNKFNAPVDTGIDAFLSSRDHTASSYVWSDSNFPSRHFRGSSTILPNFL